MLFTIGTSNRSLPEFLAELQKRSITNLIDVRSSPYSRLPWFNANQIEKWSEQAGMFYRSEGAALGGHTEILPDDRSYQQALERVLASSAREPTVIFCAEGDPAQCHRTWEVAAALLVQHGVMAKSILRDGREEDVIVTLGRVSSGKIREPLRQKMRPNMQSFNP